jgi:hypothetical protein
VTIAKRPSWSRRDERHQTTASVKTKEIYFYPKGWTGMFIPTVIPGSALTGCPGMMVVVTR